MIFIQTKSIPMLTLKMVIEIIFYAMMFQTDSVLRAQIFVAWSILSSIFYFTIVFKTYSKRRLDPQSTGECTKIQLGALAGLALALVLNHLMHDMVTRATGASFGLFALVISLGAFLAGPLELNEGKASYSAHS